MEIVFFAPMNCMVHNGQEIQNGAEFAKNGAQIVHRQFIMVHKFAHEF